MYFDLWDKWDNPDNDYNAKVAKEIDIIQRIFKMLHLLEVSAIDFSADRVQDFLKDKGNIKTDEGKRVFNIIIAEDPGFIKALEKVLGVYNQDLAKLQ